MSSCLLNTAQLTNVTNCKKIMGWKSTIDITRNEAKRLIMQKLDMLDELTNQQLDDMLEGLGYGDDANLPYYGHNFNIVDDE